MRIQLRKLQCLKKWWRTNNPAPCIALLMPRHPPSWDFLTGYNMESQTWIGPDLDPFLHSESSARLPGMYSISGSRSKGKRLKCFCGTSGNNVWQEKSNGEEEHSPSPAKLCRKVVEVPIRCQRVACPGVFANSSFQCFANWNWYTYIQRMSPLGFLKWYRAAFAFIRFRGNLGSCWFFTRYC